MPQLHTYSCHMCKYTKKTVPIETVQEFTHGKSETVFYCIHLYTSTDLPQYKSTIFLIHHLKNMHKVKHIQYKWYFQEN